MKLYVIRHCQAAGQSENAPLTSSGVEQAESLAEFLSGSGIERVICSPYLRARQSIEPFVQRYNVPLTVDARLSERVLSKSLLENWLECLKETFEDFDLEFEGGESSRRAMERAVDVIKEMNLSQSQPFAVVTHGNLMTLLLRHFDKRFGFNEWRQLTNPDVFLVNKDADKCTVERIWDAHG